MLFYLPGSQDRQKSNTVFPPTPTVYTQFGRHEVAAYKANLFFPAPQNKI